MDIRIATERKSIKSLLSEVINLVSVLLQPLTASVFWKEHSACLFLLKPSCNWSSGTAVLGSCWVRPESRCGSLGGAGSSLGCELLAAACDP